MPPITEAIHIAGHCYCGAITYEVNIPAGEAPLFTVYCHCDSCRRAHSAPLYHVACVDAPMFRLTSGAELLTEFTKPGGTLTRAFCSSCGSKILNRFGDWKPNGRVPLAFFPNTLEEATQRALPDALRPLKNSCSDECVLDTQMLRSLLAPE